MYDIYCCPCLVRSVCPTDALVFRYIIRTFGSCLLVVPIEPEPANMYVPATLNALNDDSKTTTPIYRITLFF